MARVAVSVSPSIFSAKPWPRAAAATAGAGSSSRVEMSAGASFGTQYNFNSKSGMLPFASAAFGFVQYTGDDSDRAMLLPMMRAGFRSMLGDARSLNVSVGFQHESNPESAHETSADVFDIGVGMSLFRAPR